MKPDVCPTCHRKLTYVRSNNQNRYYWGIELKILSEHTGHTTAELHELLKHKFLRTWITIQTKTGPQEVEITKSTSNLTTVQMEEYLSQVRQWASLELDCSIPEPNEAPWEIQ